MYLKSLEIQGFKSFPDKTVLQFGSDITSIVGPNGSGKSNISDAISWVMGEQSSKALRGAKMEDVIFGGTQKRAAVGFAEATLVLDNTDGALAIETPEVMITRRYYRSGESEYYINKQSARLRDINELLMDTGLGREGYSNIGQGRIDEILSLKSTERREIFEEAAGISKYRHRKEETERRLANTEDNLLRIGDKISELQLQVDPLREQAKKAEKYLALRDELKGYEVTLWLSQLDKVTQEAKKAAADYASAAFVLEQAHDELQTLYHNSEQMSLQLNQQTLQLEQQREEISRMESERQKREAGGAVLQAQIEHHQQDISRIEQELADAETRSGGVGEQIAQQRVHMDELASALAALQDMLSGLEQQSAALDAGTRQAEQAALELRAQQSLLQAEQTERRAAIASLTASMAELSQRREQLEADRAAAKERLAQIGQQKADCAARLKEAEENVTAAENTIAGYQLRLNTRAQQRDSLQKQADTAALQLDTLDAKIKMLREMERDFEGFSKAVRLVMQSAERGSLRGVHGPVSKLISVDDEYTTAIETALGAAMQQIVVDTEEDGKAAILMLKRTDGGRATFLPLSSIRGQRMQPGEAAGMAGYVGVASELVKADVRYAGVIENLLGRTMIAETLDQAIRMAKKMQSRVRIVTLDGQVMNAGGSMTGGSASRSAGVLSRANALQKLSAEREQLAQKTAQLRQRLSEAVSSAAKTEFELSTVQTRLREAEDEVLRRTEEQKQTELLLAAVQENLSGYEKELSRMQSRNSGDSGQLSALEQLLKSTEQKLEALCAQELAQQQQQAQLQEKAAALLQAITDTKMQAAANQAEQQSLQTSMAQLEALREAMQGDRSQKQRLIEDYREKIAETERQLDALHEELMQLEQQTDQARQALRAAVDARAQLEAERNRTEKQAQEKNQNILLMERESARLESKKATGELEQKQLVDKLWDSYELTPSTAEAQKVEVESLASAQRQIADLRRKISALGTPNLGAIEEFARVNERYEYLCTQRDDVTHAKTELEGIVKSITEQMTGIFVREFGRINEYFGKTFVEMFGGGKGSLELEDAASPLECGIEIKVQPPGKQLKTITLLSGGEKAFVAIALYFAILKVRPTPFCMLDEIDAALDDRNVERFATYLRNLCDKTQFIVITHRRGTMEASDVLYGVTMQEQGISKILHLNLDDMQKELGITG